jgi:O-antigen biosynthesis protein
MRVGLKKLLPLALPRALARYGGLAEDHPLVPIVCPVYRPALGDFLTAVDSVRRQTYGRWELLLVDDASEDPTLTPAMQHFERGRWPH